LIPRRYLKATLAELTNVDVKHINKAREWVTIAALTGSSGVFIQAEPRGIGKTHLAVCLMKGLALTGRINRQMTFFSFIDLLEVMAEWGDKYSDHQYSTWARRIDNSEVVLLDDLAPVGKLNIVLEQQAYRLIDLLYSQERCVIVTSNANLGQVAKLYGEAGWAMASRLTEMCPNVWDLTQKGGTKDDFRLKGGKK